MAVKLFRRLSQSADNFPAEIGFEIRPFHYLFFFFREYIPFMLLEGFLCMEFGRAVCQWASIDLFVRVDVLSLLDVFLMVGCEHMLIYVSFLWSTLIVWYL